MSLLKGQHYEPLSTRVPRWLRRHVEDRATLEDLSLSDVTEGMLLEYAARHNLIPHMSESERLALERHRDWIVMVLDSGKPIRLATRK